jgi:hypothetical protein
MVVSRIATLFDSCLRHIAPLGSSERIRAGLGDP